MKKEYLILTIVIVALAAYLLLYQKDRTHYTLPDLPLVKKGSITAIEITGPKGLIVFTKDNDSWTLTDEKFAADNLSVESMLDVIKDMTVTALVSETGDLARYHLDETNRIGIKAMSKDSVVREFFIGKGAPSFNHTFISFKSDGKVYHASGDFRASFEKDIDAFRDKTVLKLMPGNIQQITIDKDMVQKILTRQANPSNETNDKDASGEEEASIWISSDKSEVDQAFARSLVSGLSDVKCQQFSKPVNDTAMENGPALISIQINDDIYLKIYPKNSESLYPGTSSQSKYAFVLSSQTAENFILDIDKLLGIKKNEEEQGPGIDNSKEE